MHQQLKIEEIFLSGQKLTPMMEQYYSIKKKYQDHILFFRMGDFYEVFFEDAKKTAKILNISLTHRGKLGNQPIPMAGIPHHAASNYIDRISIHGIKVAICEQIENPKDAKGIVKRAVTQIVSPGIPYDLDKTVLDENHYIMATFEANQKFYLTAIDFTTGDFIGFQFHNFEDFIEKIRSLSPKEFITFQNQWESRPNIQLLINHSKSTVTYISSEYFDPTFTETFTLKLIPTIKKDQIINENKGIISPIGVLAYYIYSTQGTQNLQHIKPFSLINETDLMKVTTPTLIGIEVFPKSKETYKDSLIGFMDKTKTSMGTRRLKNIFKSPLTNKKAINKRHDTIQFFLNNEETLIKIREELENIRDIERILTKVSTNKANSSDILNLSKAISSYKKIKTSLNNFSLNIFSFLNKEEENILINYKDSVNKTLNDEIGASLDKGNLIKIGANEKRDQLAKFSENTSLELIKLEDEYRKETNISKLKIKFNNVAGYFIEVSKIHSDKIPKYFTRRQTLVNSERYSTEKLTNFEKKILVGKEELETLEREIFNSLIHKTNQINALFRSAVNSIVQIDILQSLAWIARNENFCRPKISNKKKEINLKGAWHPLIKSTIKDQFITHDLILNSDCYFGLITGPNMAGKTTVMREVAIIQLLSQIGSYVPATSVTLSICDYLFSRLGASDDILKGQSTFMVEMAETSEIIRHASEKSLIILDEVGRGTSTYDGLSIAWSIFEHFVEKTKAMCLFATHYHELISLANKYSQAKNLTVKTINKNGHVQFLYKLIEESASQSFGIYVAKLAGLPKSVLKRSEEVLKMLEDSSKNTKKVENPSSAQLDFFTIENSSSLQEIKTKLDAIQVNELTPIQALNKLNELKTIKLH